MYYLMKPVVLIMLRLNQKVFVTTKRFKLAKLFPKPMMELSALI